MKTDFQAGADEVAAIGRICQLVQGLPLAIELAARWTRTLSCAEIAEEIERGLELLSDGKPGTREGAAHRHRSMRAVFDHSWALLTAEEQHVLKRLSVFRGGFRREAAGQVSGAGLPVLSALIDKSLVWYGESGRYSMHDLVRQYLAEHLALDPAEEKSALRQHSRYYLTLLQKSEPALRSPGQKNALQTLDEDIDNIRLAWNTAVEWAAQEVAAAQEVPAQEMAVAHTTSANEDLPEAAGLLCSAAEPLYYFYELHQYFKEAEGQFRRAAEPVRQALAGGSFAGKARERLVILLAGLLNFQGFFNQRPGNNPAAQALFEESLALQRPLALSAADRFPLTFALVHLGVVRWAMGDFEQAARYLEEGLAHSQLLQVIWLRSLALGFLGGVNHDLGDYAAAQSLLREAVATCQAEGDPEINMLMVIYYTRTLLARNRLEEARALLMEGLKQVQETGNRWLTGLGLEYLARIARAAGQDREALRLMEESILLHREVGDQWSLSLGLVELCRALLRASAYGLAEQHALEALKIALDTGYTPIALEALVILASVDAGQGRTAEAMILITHILQHPASKQDTREQAEALRSEIATGLAPTQMSELEERARMKAFEAFLNERYGIA